VEGGGRCTRDPHADGVITDNEIRSLSISQRLLGTEEIMRIHNADCGMLTFGDTTAGDSTRDGRQA
jgi:carbonic anhydrase